MGVVVERTAESEPDAARVVSRDRYGAWADPSGIGLGYRSDWMMRLPDDCQMVILIGSQAELERMEPLLSDLVEDGEGAVCLEYEDR